MKKLLILLAIPFLFSCVGQQQKDVSKIDSTKSLRIVSLAQSISQEIEEMGLSSNIVGATSYCNVAKKNKNLIVGTSTEINLEKIIMLKPDIVVVSTLTENNVIETLKKSGIKVYRLGKAISFNEICNEFIKLGKELGKETVAQNIVNKSKQTVDSLKKTIPADFHKKIFFQIGAKPLYSVIPHTYMDDYIQFIGGTNIAADLNSGAVTRESVVQRNPDIIFVVTMGIVGEEEINIWKNYKQINAVKNNQIFVLNSDIACAPTPLSFVETFREIVKQVHFDK